MSDWKEKLAGRLVIASVSGGKDSAAMSLWLTEQGVEHRRVFADTGWEHGWTYEYLRGPLVKALGPIDEVKSAVGGMADWTRKKGMFPSRLRRFCTEELKVRPLAAYVRAAQDEVGEVVNAVGIRAAESQARSTLPEWEGSDAFDCDVWRPLLHWSEQDVIDIHRRHGLAPNPLYLKGASRVGCWPCIFSRKEEVRLVAELSPERIAEIRRLEVEVTAAAMARNAAKVLAGAMTEEEEEVQRLYMPRTFFHGKTTRTGTPHPIDEVVAWSRTAKGGRQFMLLDDQPEGCVRWGLCESGGAP